MLRENITTISGLKYHLLDLPNNTLSNNINYQMSKNSYKNAWIKRSSLDNWNSKLSNSLLTLHVIQC